MKRNRALAFLLVLLLMLPLFASAAASLRDSLAKLSDDDLLLLQQTLQEELESRGLTPGENTTRSARVAEDLWVWIPKSGSKYHNTPTCSHMKKPTQVSLDVAKAAGFTPCKKCDPPK